ncbi:protein of unknown function DUF167 [Thioalkalivibrio nitratireducens DSM 14787]|uniref:UPF0235 protein TVNIR_1335 n=1 Tax=Thioalkalivibrio nitratireducens (strain DSM 14787 / UNIQEM 213 / ALEN2) TaxID=1255043 RepID=L0DVF5_THIND|nr:DUF167 domain-containing protein [Thioalkalivibrio nitratireducens]AGA33008.1 protein of unknown function DUF167 [Thioalkalivibrio nitratireducens DSM 14787]
MTAAPLPRLLQVRVKPGARVSELRPGDDGTWIARVKAPPVDGRANDELVALIARQFGVARRQIRIRRGASGRSKWVEVAD